MERLYDNDTDATKPIVFSSESVNDNDTIFNVAQVEQKPTFPGGDEALYKYLAKNLIYPPIAKQNGIQGMVVCNIIIEKDGSLSNIKILKDIGGGCKEEAERIISSMPKWNPANHKGKVVRCNYTFFINFKL